MHEREEILTGGNMTAVVRVGATVRRTAGPWTPTVHAFLRHLRAAGFRLAPEPLGLDEQGREILTLLPGVAPTYPLPGYVRTDATLAAVASTLRAFHDASAGFAAAEGAVAPLTAPANPDVPYRGEDEQARRLVAFCEAYGDPRIRPAEVVRAAADELRELVAFVEAGAAAGDPAQLAVRERGDVAIYERDIAHLTTLNR